MQGCYKLGNAGVRPSGGGRRNTRGGPVVLGPETGRKETPALRQSYKTALLWIFLIVMFVALWQFFEHNGRQV